MQEYSLQNKKAWEFNAYEFWVKESGKPADRARKALADPIGMLKRYAAYFDTYTGIRVANICGSCGKKAIPLAILGADVTIFDISEDNKRYALEVAEHANVNIDFQVGDVLEIDLKKYGQSFDVVFMEGGILHYFHNIDTIDYQHIPAAHPFAYNNPLGNFLSCNAKTFCKGYRILGHYW